MPTHLVEMTAIWQRPLFTVKHSYGSDKKVTNMIANIAKELAKLVNQNAKLDLQHPNDFVLLEPLPTEGMLLLDRLASIYQLIYQVNCFRTTPLELFILLYPRNVRQIY